MMLGRFWDRRPNVPPMPSPPVRPAAAGATRWLEGRAPSAARMRACAREEERDQAQPIGIPRIQIGKTGRSRTRQGNRNDWHGQASDGPSCGKGACHVCSLYVPVKTAVPIEETGRPVMPQSRPLPGHEIGRVGWLPDLRRHSPARQLCRPHRALRATATSRRASCSPG